ncbi:MAG: DUF3626 domain-containing protein [Erythrobacter sp.]|uniref:DUF3626 domain-containing protein n=1 Tax=Erythrobacter sp. TaxID=1042 RepID=UPI003A893078
MSNHPEQVGAALEHVRQRASFTTPKVSGPITLNFHPDLLSKGRLVIEEIARHGCYRSQFETGTSSGGLSAHKGGDRWNWESRIFGGVYDHANASIRPKYGALNYRCDPFGGSPRFGSSFLRLTPHVWERTSFCYPDSHFDPEDFAVGDAQSLIDLCDENPTDLDISLDNYIEAHVHGPVEIARDVEALVLDPSFKGTPIEQAASQLDCRLEWHCGFSLEADRANDCAEFRGQPAAQALLTLASGGPVTPRTLGQARSGLLDYQTAKWLWHCLAKFGRMLPSSEPEA